MGLFGNGINELSYGNSASTFPNQPAPSFQTPQVGYGQQDGMAPAYAPTYPPMAQPVRPSWTQGLIVPGSHGASYDLSRIAALSQAEFKFFVECSQYTRGDFAPMVKHCVNTTLDWTSRLDGDGGVDAYMIDGTQQEAVRVQPGQQQAFAGRVMTNQSTRRPAVASVLRTMAQEMLDKAANHVALRPHVLLFAISGHHFDDDAIVQVLTHVKDTLKSMGYPHPERMLMVGFIKVGERGVMFDSSTNNLRKLDNHAVVGRMVECDTKVSGNMEERIYKMLERFCHPEANGDNKLAGFAQNMLSKVIH